jgi:hypothetical protein
MLYLFHFGGHIRGHIIKTIIAVTERTTIKLLLLTAIPFGYVTAKNIIPSSIKIQQSFLW